MSFSFSHNIKNDFFRHVSHIKVTLCNVLCNFSIYYLIYIVTVYILAKSRESICKSRIRDIQCVDQSCVKCMKRHTRSSRRQMVMVLSSLCIGPRVSESLGPIIILNIIYLLAVLRASVRPIISTKFAYCMWTGRYVHADDTSII